MRSAPEPPVRELIRRYVPAWLAALPAGAEALVVDAFAGRDHPDSPGPVPEVARAVAASLERAARHGSAERLSWLLLEEDPAKVEWLRLGLERAGVRVGRGGGAAELEEATPDGERIAARAAATGQALLALDPHRPEQLPLELVEAVLAAPGTDAVVRLPTAGLRRLAAHRGTPLADLPPLARRAVDGWSRLLGDPRRGWVVAWSEALAAGGVEVAVASVVQGYAARLRAAGRWTAVRAVHGPFEGPAEHLLVASGEPTRALLLNPLLDAMRAEALVPWEDDEDDALVRYRQTGVMELFGPGRGEERERTVDVLGLAHLVASRFACRNVTWREVVAAFLDTRLHEEDLRRAALALRREGRALFRTLAEPDAVVAFPRGAPRRAGRRRGTAQGGDLSLPLDGAEPEDGPGR